MSSFLSAGLVEYKTFHGFGYKIVPGHLQSNTDETFATSDLDLRFHPL